jgi:hypothetical protein
MIVPVSFIGIIAALVANSRLVRTRKPGAQRRPTAPASERIAKT